MKKVGMLVNSIGFGGNERSVVNVATAIGDRLDVTVITQEDCGNHYNYKGKVINMDTPCADTMLGKVFNSIRRIIRFKKIVKDNHFDTVFIILPVSNPINYLRLGCKKIVSCRDCGDLIKRTDKYIMMTKSSDLIVSNSEYQSDYLVKKAPRLSDKSKVIYNIIDIDRIGHLKSEEPDQVLEQFMQGHKCVISTGRFADAKGLNNLLKSFSLLSKRDDDVRLVMIGDGDLRDKIEKLIEDLNLNDKVILPGFLDNPFKYITRADVFVLPSFYEGFPNTLIEAMACGTPVIATDCPSGPAEILCGTAENGSTITEYGVLLRPFVEQEATWNASDIRSDHREFADAMEKVLQDQNLAHTISENAYDRIKCFTAEKIAGDWIEIL